MLARETMWVTRDPFTPHVTVDAGMVLKIASYCAPWPLSIQIHPSSAVWKLVLYCCCFGDEIDNPMECLNIGGSHIHQSLGWEDREWTTEMAAKLTGPRLTSWRLKLCINFFLACRNDCLLWSCQVCPSWSERISHSHNLWLLIPLLR